MTLDVNNLREEVVVAIQDVWKNEDEEYMRQVIEEKFEGFEKELRAMIRYYESHESTVPTYTLRKELLGE